jgi:hypothetical protein
LPSSSAAASCSSSPCVDTAICEPSSPRRDPWSQIIAFLYWRRRRRTRFSSRDNSAVPSTKATGFSGSSRTNWGKDRPLSDEYDGIELAGSTDARAWASTASINLTPGDEHDDGRRLGGGERYMDHRYAASGDSLAFDDRRPVEDDYGPVGADRAPSPMPTTREGDRSRDELR